MRKTDQNLVTVKGTILPDQNQEVDIESKCWVLFIISTLQNISFLMLYVSQV